MESVESFYSSFNELTAVIFLSSNSETNARRLCSEIFVQNTSHCLRSIKTNLERG